MSWPDNTVASDRRYPRIIRAFAAATSVGAETPLLALTELGMLYKDLAFTLRNHDAVNRAALYIDQSESGSVSSEDRSTVYVSALKERTLEFRDVLRLKWGVAASGDPDAGFTAVNVSWQVTGRLRVFNT